MNPLLKLMALNKGVERRFEVKADAQNGEVTIYLYDMIVGDDLTAEWYGGVSAVAFIRELKAITAPVIHLRINSPGGDVFAARVMEQAIREHASKVIAHIDGYAASAASYLALACDEVVMAKGGFFMIHKAWTIAAGNEHDFTSTATLLGKIDESLVTSYADETGQKPEQLREWMAAETWFNAEESIQYGFADSIAEAAPKACATWNLSAYEKAPKPEASANSMTIKIDASDVKEALDEAIASIKAEMMRAEAIPQEDDSHGQRTRNIALITATA